MRRRRRRRPYRRRRRDVTRDTWRGTIVTQRLARSPSRSPPPPPHAMSVLTSASSSFAARARDATRETTRARRVTDVNMNYPHHRSHEFARAVRVRASMAPSRACAARAHASSMMPALAFASVASSRGAVGVARSTHEDGRETSFFVDDGQSLTIRDRAIRACALVTGYFPLLVFAGAVLGMTSPSTVSWFKGDAVTYALASTMLGMGITLEKADFVKILAAPWKIGMGVALQYTVMPTLAFLIARTFLGDAASLAAGLILVGCCPGGTASNVVTFLAGASVPLSVVLTTVSTLMATVMTPTLTKQLAGTVIGVDGVGLFLSTCKVVLLPIIAGVALKHFARDFSETYVEPFAPAVAVITVAAICSSIIGRTSTQILAAGPTLLGSVALLHTLGFALGFFLSRAAGFSTKTSRTMSIEVGMQNSALGVVLASAHFADPLVAVPCAISATVHSVLGSSLAAAWKYRDANKAQWKADEIAKRYADPNYSAYNDEFRKATGLSNI
jgi:bile acid:Na+ symporter, BASS family